MKEQQTKAADVGQTDDKGRIAEATGAAVAKSSPTANLVQDAMTQAIKDAADAGITNPVEIKELMMAARQRVNDEAAAAE